MSEKHLFLFGGGAPFNDSLGKKFAGLSSHNANKVAILFVEQDGWKAYMSRYTDLLERNGVSDFVYISLCASPSIEVIQELRSATGVIICGGETELYRDCIVDTELGDVVKELYVQGVPIAGFSAGALISPSVCVIPPIDNRKNEHLFLKGLGLVNNCVVSAHFTKWNEEENLMAALSKTNLAVGYGIDDESGIYLMNEKLAQSAGQVFYYHV
ncbi:Type 1 glutamine amidotransferase-like domain-containing protein [Paenibacillus sp. MMS18-CY102]|uniref:Type 1 glutamine amidotransferase-like domain-containing protein n=1 Tax=Paenibacillus sp. MMS18-CY102 TaxID=2682849 RepID=UPI0013660770|nr:Type 1 glutamine amidotransferase-like domain-containing protein [Paenibacillus sp. MMS18-CY102]MWC31372.1 peptidase S51 dipeptidase E [Paenibacillus sp. MMS18-CY102]